jgi:hypothetical protein
LLERAQRCLILLQFAERLAEIVLLGGVVVLVVGAPHRILEFNETYFPFAPRNEKRIGVRPYLIRTRGRCAHVGSESGPVTHTRSQRDYPRAWMAQRALAVALVTTLLDATVCPTSGDVSTPASPAAHLNSRSRCRQVRLWSARCGACAHEGSCRFHSPVRLVAATEPARQLQKHGLSYGNTVFPLIPRCPGGGSGNYLDTPPAPRTALWCHLHTWDTIYHT